MTADDFRRSLRRLNRDHYPELAGYTRDEIYGDGDRMAPGGLFLAARMSRGLPIGIGDRVLDLGCGLGDSSIYLARRFGVRVTAVDLWVAPETLAEKFDRHGLGDAITPLRLDLRRPLPFAENYFGIVFSMQSFHAYGASTRNLRSILRHLEPGGHLVLGTTCFNEEPGPELPSIYHASDGFDTEYESYHSPGWWSDHLKASGQLELNECAELHDGVVMWEDEFAYSGDRADWNDEWFQSAKWLAKHLEYGRTNTPYLTHMVARAIKRPPTNHTT